MKTSHINSVRILILVGNSVVFHYISAVVHLIGYGYIHVAPGVRLTIYSDITTEQSPY